MADIDRQSAWCNTHDDIAWLYGDGSTQCMYCLAVETSSTDCDVTAISDDRAELREQVARLTQELDAAREKNKKLHDALIVFTPREQRIRMIDLAAEKDAAEAQVLLLARTLRDGVDLVYKRLPAPFDSPVALERTEWLRTAREVLASLPKPEG